MAITPVDPTTGLPNSSPAYFPAFPAKWTIPPFPPVGQGNWALGPVVVAVQDTPEMRTPPFNVGDTGVITPPAGVGADRGTFTTWDDVTAEIEETGVETHDTFTVEEAMNAQFGAGTYEYTGPVVAAGAGPFTLNPAQWQVAARSAGGEQPHPARRKPKGRNRKS